MILKSIATAVPAHRFTQIDCYSALESSAVFASLNASSRNLLKHVLNDSKAGIEARNFAVESIAAIFERSAQQMNEAFEAEAPALAGKALAEGLDKAAMDAQELDALFVCTCTGYLCPGVSSHVAERLGMRSDAFLSDIVGLGCGAALPTLRSAAGFLALHPDAKVAVVAVEVCSAAFFASDDPGVLVSLCLFGDGAAAAVLSNSGNCSRQWNIGHFSTLHLPQHRESIRFTNAGGKLRNQLSRAVPAIAADAVARLFAGRKSEPDRILTHSGGRDVIVSLENALSVRLNETRAVLAEYGNMSSPSVLFALETALETADPDQAERFWLAAFGAGFSAHSCEVWRRA